MNNTKHICVGNQKGHVLVYDTNLQTQHDNIVRPLVPTTFEKWNHQHGMRSMCKLNDDTIGFFMNSKLSDDRTSILAKKSFQIVTVMNPFSGNTYRLAKTLRHRIGIMDLHGILNTSLLAFGIHHTYCKIFDWESIKPTHTIQPSSKICIDTITSNPMTQHLFIGGHTHNQSVICEYDISRDGPTKIRNYTNFYNFLGGASGVTDIVFDDKLMYSIRNNGSLDIWTQNDGLHTTSSTRGNYFQSICVNSDKNLIFVGGDGKIFVFDRRNISNIIQIIKVHASENHYTCKVRQLSDDLFMSSNAHTVSLWTSTGKVIKETPKNKHFAICVL